jgi:uncharacterized protein involved in high-affinity Fe2+ transport
VINRTTVARAIVVACAAVAVACTGATGTAAAANSLPAPVPIQTLATATWQGMEILAQASTPLPFVVYDGTSERLVKPTRNDSMHLMVMLTDQHTGVPIPYASVWATIRTAAGKIVYDARQWPMIARYMGPHYGNDVALPGAGRYSLTLLISPPVAARPRSLGHVWLHAHKVTLHFAWKPAKGV